MSGLVILTFVPALAAIMFWMRARAEMRRRIAAERRLADAATHASSDAGHAEDPAARRRRLLGVVAHELRSPISAIVGYQELLSEGIFGALDPRAHDATLRIRHSANQLLNLVDGMYELAHSADVIELELGEVHLPDLLAEALRAAEAEGAGRGVSVTGRAAADLPRLITDGERLRRSLDLLVAAGIKASPGATITISASASDESISIAVDGTSIDLERDAPDPDAPESFRSGIALRIAMAGIGARSLGGHVDYRPADGATRLTLTVPLRPAAAD